MAILITGPSSVGKSTFISSQAKAEFGADLPKVAYGAQALKDGFAPDALVHYNLLHQALSFGDDYVAANKRWNFLAEPVFVRIVESGLIERCIVLVAPLAELMERMKSRTRSEHFKSTEYDGNRWRTIVQQIDLFRVYERLFTVLDQRNIPYQVLFSSADQPQPFQMSDRVFVHANLRGRFVSVPPVEKVMEVIAHPGSRYQTVVMPHGLKTAAKGYKHLGSGRHSTFERILVGNLNNASILDVGCALGDLLFNAERLGATRLLGIERDPDRYEAACKIAKLLHSNAVFEQGDFTMRGAGEIFDHVFALNVIHHVPDFHRFLAQAAAAAGKTLTIEFPTLEDPRFRKLYGFSQEQVQPFNALPFIGVSGQAVDQSYVYSPFAVQRIMEEIGGFARSQIADSPIAGRVIMRFFREPERAPQTAGS